MEEQLFVAAAPPSLSTSTGSLITLDDVAVVHRGVIDGATFAVAVPRDVTERNGQCLLIHAHGFRPVGTPPFAEVDDPFWVRLVQMGWVVAGAFAVEGGERKHKKSSNGTVYSDVLPPIGSDCGGCDTRYLQPAQLGVL